MQVPADLYSAVKSIRHFNRYYTNRLGLLSRYRLDTNFTLTESRVLFEIARRGEHSQTALGAELKLDLGYLNRIVKRFVSADLVSIRRDPADGRARTLRLTESGREAVRRIDESSDAETEELLAGLGEEEIESLVRSLRAAEEILEHGKTREIILEPVTGGHRIETIRTLVREYLDFLNADLSFQDVEAEFAGLPGKYAPPEGALFLASVPMIQGGSESAGCVALRSLGNGVCEMKRLYVRPEYRGSGIGKLLAERIIREARTLGYRRMRLDTLERLKGAVSLYRSLGFRTIPPYCENPLPGALFWELEL